MENNQLKQLENFVDINDPNDIVWWLTHDEIRVVSFSNNHGIRLDKKMPQYKAVQKLCKNFIDRDFEGNNGIRND